jgi:tetratricopeptide (TPR) repeat protein
MNGALAFEFGEFEEAIAWLKRSIRAGHEYGMVFMEAMPMCTLGSVLLEISDEFIDEVAKIHTQALQLLELPGGEMAGGTAWADLGFCALTLGDVDRALGFFEKGLTTPTPYMLLQRPRFLIGLAQVAIHRGNLEEAARHLDDARRFAEERTMINLYPQIAHAEAQVYIAFEQYENAFAKLAAAEELALEMGMRLRALQASVLAARLFSSLNQEDAATAKIQAAKSIATEIAGSIKDPHLRDLYLKKTAKLLG